MLRLSTRLMLIAASHLVQGYNNKTKITAPYIAERCNMNSRALMPALRRLTQVGILRSQTGGSEPGFILSRAPSEISMYEIIGALEDDMLMPSCKEMNDTLNCEITNCENCSIYKVINIGISRITTDLKNTSLLQHYELSLKE